MFDTSLCIRFKGVKDMLAAQCISMMSSTEEFQNPLIVVVQLYSTLRDRQHHDQCLNKKSGKENLNNLTKQLNKLVA